jgi:hypothetical protein
MAIIARLSEFYDAPDRSCMVPQGKPMANGVGYRRLGNNCFDLVFNRRHQTTQSV